MKRTANQITEIELEHKRCNLNQMNRICDLHMNVSNDSINQTHKETIDNERKNSISDDTDKFDDNNICDSDKKQDFPVFQKIPQNIKGCTSKVSTEIRQSKFEEKMPHLDSSLAKVNLKFISDCTKTTLSNQAEVSITSEKQTSASKDGSFDNGNIVSEPAVKSKFNKNNDKGIVSYEIAEKDDNGKIMENNSDMPDASRAFVKNMNEQINSEKCAATEKMTFHQYNQAVPSCHVNYGTLKYSDRESVNMRPLSGSALGINNQNLLQYGKVSQPAFNSSESSCLNLLFTNGSDSWASLGNTYLGPQPQPLPHMQPNINHKFSPTVQVKDYNISETSWNPKNSALLAKHDVQNDWDYRQGFHSSSHIPFGNASLVSCIQPFYNNYFEKSPVWHSGNQRWDQDLQYAHNSSLSPWKPGIVSNTVSKDGQVANWGCSQPSLMSSHVYKLNQPSSFSTPRNSPQVENNVTAPTICSTITDLYDSKTKCVTSLPTSNTKLKATSLFPRRDFMPLHYVNDAKTVQESKTSGTDQCKESKNVIFSNFQVSNLSTEKVKPSFLIEKYIDYLLIENENITEMSRAFTPPSALFSEEDTYLLDCLKNDVKFPTIKFIEFVQKYFPHVNLEAVSFLEDEYRFPAKRCIRSKEDLLQDTFFYFQMLKKAEQVS